MQKIIEGSLLLWSPLKKNLPFCMLSLFVIQIEINLKLAFLVKDCLACTKNFPKS